MQTTGSQSCEINWLVFWALADKIQAEFVAFESEFGAFGASTATWRDSQLELVYKGVVRILRGIRLANRKFNDSNTMGKMHVRHRACPPRHPAYRGVRRQA
jgi:hypothetical protein